MMELIYILRSKQNFEIFKQNNLHYYTKDDFIFSIIHKCVHLGHFEHSLHCSTFLRFYTPKTKQ